MSDRRRIVVVTTLLLGLIAALVLGASIVAAQEAGDDSDAELPLTVTLTSSRDVCTANTLTDLSWTITGGKAPYRLSIDGEQVDRKAESHRINCGPLATDPESGDPLPDQTKTFTATVTDARGVSATGTDLAELLPPLPAPEATAVADVMRFFLRIEWRGLTVPASCDVPTGCYAFRTRLAGDTSWVYGWDEHEDADLGWAPWVARAVAAGTTVEAGIAAIRDPIEIETPAALNWAATAQATSLADISGLTATATHDTVTVRWNRQPSADIWWVNISGTGLGGGQLKTIESRGPAESVAGWGDPTSATHEVTFVDLSPDTEYYVRVSGPHILEAGPTHAVEASTTVRTAVAPAEYTPLARGPQNLRASATHDTITVRWDHPQPDTEDDYWLYIAGPYGDRFVNGSVWPPDSEYTFDDLLPNSTYLIRVMHNDITRESAEITITTRGAPLTGTAGAAGETGAQASSRPAQTCIEITPGWRICFAAARTAG